MKKYLTVFLVLVICITLFTIGMSCVKIYAAENICAPSTLSTEELVEEILFENKMAEMYLFDNLQTGIAYYKTHNELFIELVSRNDCGAKLISIHNALLGSSEEQALNIARLLLQQYEIYSKLSLEEKNIVDSFQSILTVVEINATQPLSDTESSYVYTPNGSAVAVKELDYITEDANLDSNYIANAAANYGVISTISGPTTKYNCHSFAWYSQNYDLNCYWMDDPSTYYSDSSYISSDAAENYILCYYAKMYYTLLDGTLISDIVTVNSHSAIITHVGSNFNKNDISTLDSIMVTSKWGAWGLYEHYGDDCPYVMTSRAGTELQYMDENGEVFSVPVYLVSEFSHVEVYRPRTNATYTLSNSMNDLSISRTVNGSGSITGKYGMYELNVTSAGQYTITIQSNDALSNRLYNANMNLIPITAPTSSTGDYTYAVNLSAGRYYLRTSYIDTTNSGTISITIEPHSHSYDWWTYYNSSTHIQCCSCGLRGIATAVHAIRSSDIVDNKAACLGCGRMLDLNSDTATITPDNAAKISVNGSYILPSGIIILVDEDVEAYLNGTLVFYDKDELPVTG